MIIEQNISLKPYHTFGTTVDAAHWAIARTVADWMAVVQHRRSQPMPILVLGGGSNVLFTKPFKGLVVQNMLKGIHVIQEDEEAVWVKAASGESWNDLVQWAIEQNYGGIENLVAIPGTVGAAPIQNIGAYGTELKDVLESLEAMHLETGETKQFPAQACRFGYRDSVFKNDLKGQYVILSITLRLQKSPKPNLSYAEVEAVLRQRHIAHPSIRQVAAIIAEIRQQKLPDPTILGNAGSFFKNPIISKRHFLALQDEFPQMSGHPISETQIKISAAWLVEQTGWKGKRIGDAGVYARHALILVNHGNASGDDIRNLAFDILDAVQQKFNIVMVPEVNML